MIKIVMVLALLVQALNHDKELLRPRGRPGEGIKYGKRKSTTDHNC